MFFEEFDQILAGNPPVLRAGDPIAAEPTGIKPFTDSARGHFTDLSDLSGCEDLHLRLSILFACLGNRLDCRSAYVPGASVLAPCRWPDRSQILLSRLWGYRPCIDIWIGASTYLLLGGGGSVPSVQVPLNNDIGRPRAWRWAKIRRMENLPFDQMPIELAPRPITRPTDACEGEATRWIDAGAGAQHAPFKARPLEAGSPLRSAARDDRDDFRAGPGRSNRLDMQAFR